MKKLISILLSAAMLLTLTTGLDLTAYADATTYSNGDIIEFGSYPQSEVTDEEDLDALNSLDTKWESYGYMSGDGNSGSAQSSDYMKYADVTYNDCKYRAVTFSTYRPYRTSYASTTSTENTNQDDNGYTIGNIYWFKYEPLKWKILDAETGLVMSQSIIDSQAYSDTKYHCSSTCEYYKDSSYTTYANNYYESTIREWLNDDFYNTAFSSSEKKYINVTEIDNVTPWSSDYSKYDSDTSYDHVFLASYSDVLNTNYGFSSDTVVADSSRVAKGTDYAKCQGLHVHSSTGASWRCLRSAGVYSYSASCVSCDGVVLGNGDVNDTEGGVRPLLELNLTAYESSKGGTYENLTYEIIDGNAVITACDTSASGKVEIPRTINDYPVTEIGFGAFKDCTKITEIVMPDSVTSIVNRAFANCSGLKNITLSKNITEIGYATFESCSSLEEINIPDSVQRIGQWAFLNCTSLKTVNFGSGDLNLEVMTFLNCSALKEVTIPDNVTAIGRNAIGYYEDDTSEDIEYKKYDGITIIGSAGSAAETYANENGFTFVNIDNTDVITTPSDNSNTQNSTVDTGNNTPSASSTTPQTTTSSTDSANATTSATVTNETPTGAELINGEFIAAAQKNTKISKLKKGKKSATVQWKKVKGISGYQVQAATDKKFKKGKKSVTVKKQKTTKTTLKKLKSKKTYYVRIRTYKVVDGKKVYSKWSKVKTVKTK